MQIAVEERFGARNATYTRAVTLSTGVGGTVAGAAQAALPGRSRAADPSLPVPAGGLPREATQSADHRAARSRQDRPLRLTRLVKATYAHQEAAPPPADDSYSRRSRGTAWLSLAKRASLQGAMRVNVGQAKTGLSKLLARAEAGEDVEIARNGVPVARLVRIDRSARPGERFLSARGSLAGQIWIGEDFELTDAEIDEMVGDAPA